MSKMGLHATVLFSMFQFHRNKLLDWLSTRPKEVNHIMEAVVRVVTLTGQRDEPSVALGSIAKNRSPSVGSGGGAGGAKLGKHGDSLRQWTSMDGACWGRFVPDTEKAQLQKLRQSIDHTHDFEEWLRLTTTLSVDTEVNVQLGEFTLKKHQMQLLPDEILGCQDFVTVFGHVDPTLGESVRCAEVKNTTYRSWLRLVGRRHDVQVSTFLMFYTHTYIHTYILAYLYRTYT
jgi:hypothetical protein